MPCIHVTKGELAEIFARWPGEISRVAEWEKLVAAVSRRGNSTFFRLQTIPTNRNVELNLSL